MNWVSLSRKTSAGVLLLCMLIGAFFAFRLSLAENYNYQARRFELHWGKVDKAPGLAEWQRAIDWMGRALSLSHVNPAFYLRDARLKEWYAFTPEASGEQIREKLNSAEISIDRAIELRPDSALGYSARALLAARQWNLEGSLADDMVSALQLGPWELDVHLQVTHAAMATWDMLRSDAQSSFLAHVDNLAQHKQDWLPRTLDIASQYQRARILCDRLEQVSFTPSFSSILSQCPNLE